MAYGRITTTRPGVRDYSPSYGGVPTVPSPGATAGAAIGENISNLGQLYNLASSANAFQNRQLAGGLEANLPDYRSMIEESSGNIGSMLRGEVPQDVVSEILQGAAERGIMTGTVGSPNANTALLRALGLTSLGLQQTGEESLTRAIGRTPVAQPLDLARFMITPEMAQEAEMAQNLYASAPSPIMAAGAAMGAASPPGRGWKSTYPVGPSIGRVLSREYPGGLPGPGEVSSPWETGYGEFEPVGAYPENVIDPEAVGARWQDWASGLPRPAPAAPSYEDYAAYQLSALD